MKDIEKILAKCKDAIKGNDPEVRAELYEAIIDYISIGEIPEMSPTVKLAFEFVKNHIDKSETIRHKRSEAGKLGNEKRWNKSQTIANNRKLSQNGICDEMLSQNIATNRNVSQNEICDNLQSQNLENIDNQAETIANNCKISQKNTENLNNTYNNNYITDKEKINKKEREDSSCSCFEKDSKGKNFVKPTIEEIQNYVLEKNYHINPEKFFNYYESNGWRVGKNPMKNWRSAVGTWEANEKDKGDHPKEAATKGTKIKFGFTPEQLAEISRQTNAFMRS